MRLTAVALAAVLVVASMVSTARADVSTTTAQPWRRGDDALRALAAWRRCPELAQALMLDDEDLVVARRLAVRPAGGGLEVSLADEGSGRWAYGAWTWLRLARGRCAAAGYVIEGGKDAIWGGLRRISLGGAPLPSLTEIAAWHGGPLVDRDPEGPSLAAARLVVQLARDLADGVEPDPWPAQPAQPGRPRGSPAAVWTKRALAAVAVDDPWSANESGEAFDAIAHWPVRAPSLLLVAGDRWEIWELRFRARLGGGLLAVYDRRTDRHRWVWTTAYDNGDRAHFRVVVDERRLFVCGRFDGDARPRAIDLASGALRAEAEAEAEAACRRSP